MTRITRRQFAGRFCNRRAICAQDPALAASDVPKPRFGLRTSQRAHDLALAPFDTAVPPRLPDPFDALDFDTWRGIRFKREHDIFAGADGGFRLETFHLGFLYRRPMTVNMIRDGIATPIPYSPALFDYGRLKVEKAPPVNTGFAGFRLHFPVNEPHVHDEVISFLGASYFAFSAAIRNMGFPRERCASRPAPSTRAFRSSVNSGSKRRRRAAITRRLCAARRRGCDRSLQI
jgi:glucans biosynthesis protein